jgi:hypothetical protein
MAEFALQLLAPLLLGLLAWPVVAWRRRVADREATCLALAGQRASAQVIEVWKDPDGWNVTYQFKAREGGDLIVRTETLEVAVEQPAKVAAMIEVAFEPTPPFYSRIVRASLGRETNAQ